MWRRAELVDRLDETRFILDKDRLWRIQRNENGKLYTITRVQSFLGGRGRGDVLFTRDNARENFAAIAQDGKFWRLDDDNDDDDDECFILKSRLPRIIRMSEKHWNHTARIFQEFFRPLRDVIVTLSILSIINSGRLCNNKRWWQKKKDSGATRSRVTRRTLSWRL